MKEEDLTRGCILPIAQSAVIFLIMFAMGFALASWQKWEGPASLALLAGAAGAMLTFTTGILAWRRETYGQQEPIFHVADAEPKRVRIELVKPGDGPSQTTQFIDLDISPEQLGILADGLLNGKPFTENVWTGFGKPFSRSQFASLRAEFMRRGWADWRNPEAPAQGVTLRPPGRAVLRTYANETVRPTPPHDNRRK